jgi:sortase B
MRQRVLGWGALARAARVGNRLLDKVIALLLIVALLYGGFGLWDTWNIYRGTSLSSDLLQYRPTWLDQDAPNPTLAQLQEINPDVCAWLTLDDTNIDYPVVQGTDNQKYLNTAVDGTFSLSGTIFLDYRNQSDFSDAYSIIYGHHMEGGVMFGQLTDFRQKAFFEDHPTGYLFLPDHTYVIRWFACVETNAYDQSLTVPRTELTESSVAELLDSIQALSLQYRDIGVTASDRLITLVTCSTAGTDARTLLIGRLE